MGKAKELVVKFIAKKDADRIVKRNHYSGKVCNNSQLNFGVFYQGRLEGALQFGPPIDRRKVIGLVRDTQWHDFIELNRMAFSERLPRNSESRAISICFRLIKKYYPNIEWVLSFSDATRCGDGTIYRAAGFVLTQINRNSSIIKLPDGTVTASITYTAGKNILKTGGAATLPEGAEYLDGFQLRYIYFIQPAARERLTVPIIPFSAIAEAGATMYKGQQGLHASEAGDGHDQ